jgi:hypothetical protein
LYTTACSLPVGITTQALSNQCSLQKLQCSLVSTPPRCQSINIQAVGKLAGFTNTLASREHQVYSWQRCNRLRQRPPALPSLDSYSSALNKRTALQQVYSVGLLQPAKAEGSPTSLSAIARASFSIPSARQRRAAARKNTENAG